MFEKNKKWIIATDIDGTFVGHDPNMSINVKNFEAIKKLNEDHIVVLTTGRSWIIAKGIYEQLNLTTPVITFHGAVLSDPSNKLIEFPSFKYSVSRDVIKKLVKETDLIDDVLSFHVVGDKQIASFLNKNEAQKLWFDSFETVFMYKSDKFNKNEKNLIAQIEKFSDEFVYRKIASTKHNVTLITISPKDTDKADALKILAEYYDIPRERVIYFGDNSNDLKAIEWAGTGVAVGNAIDAVKKISDVVLEKTNDEGAVGDYLLSLLKK